MIVLSSCLFGRPTNQRPCFAEVFVQNLLLECAHGGHGVLVLSFSGSFEDQFILERRILSLALSCRLRMSQQERRDIGHVGWLNGWWGLFGASQTVSVYNFIELFIKVGHKSIVALTRWGELLTCSIGSIIDLYLIWLELLSRHKALLESGALEAWVDDLAPFASCMS